jgi:hypothetical protein
MSEAMPMLMLLAKFIHPAGIKDREWYRHLGVAPGKWLGKCTNPQA